MIPPLSIHLRGVRQNNLKNLDVDIPIGKLTVVTGLSGTGKSSLVFETLHAEGQRRYVETFSAYTRQFMDMLDRPDVEFIENIRPSIAIEQSNTVKTSRSTVGTMTELCDYFKVWFCQQAHLFDPETGKEVKDDTPQSIWNDVLGEFLNEAVLLCFSVNPSSKLGIGQIAKSLSAQGYARFYYKGTLYKTDASEMPSIEGDAPLFVIQDRVTLSEASRTRFIEACSTALHFGNGHIHLLNTEGEPLRPYSEGLHSPESGRTFKRAIPNLFSFNSPIGACPKCRGFGRIIEIDYRLIIPDESLSIEAGAIRAFQGEIYQESQKDLIRICRKRGIPTHIPYAELSDEEKRFVIDGEPDFHPKGDNWTQHWYGVKRFFEWLESNSYKMHVRVFLSKYRSYVTCPDCEGKRLQPEALNWKWENYTLPDLYLLSIKKLRSLLQTKAPHTEDQTLQAILTRLNFLESVGLGYLNLDRASRTLSGGEVERVNLTSCLGTGLVDTLFVLDEPSVGLHARDIGRLIEILQQLTALGNTVVVVEHDESIMRAADNIIELGPTPGQNGGEITFKGSPQEILCDTASVTGAYLSGRLPGSDKQKHRPLNKATRHLKIEEAWKHNLRGLSVSIPLNRFVVFSGVSGSGKSTLLNHVIYQNLQAQRGIATEDPATVKSITSELNFSDIVLVDQSPVSKTPRSNPALFTKAWDYIRKLYAKTEEAQSSGFLPSDFSFNTGSGRCECCSGLGYEKVEMQFMADVYIRCHVCDGKRFNREMLSILWKGKSIDEILQMTVDEALSFFSEERNICRCLKGLSQVGLGYLPLGQPLNTLSGGESQRLKLVSYLSEVKEGPNNALILLDEPTTGLHRHDITRLVEVLQQLVDAGHSLIVIEHHMDILKAADWIVEIGPDAGDEGGSVVFCGTPEAMAEAETETSPFIKEILAPESFAAVAEQPQPVLITPPRSIRIRGARENNLKNLSLEIHHKEITVITGVSGSGKSSLAFDIIFAEGQRRFMESMSPWARQFVEQMPRPELDQIHGLPPSVAIEQRGSYGTRKSTVATITEVAQYLRLLYSRIGIPYSLITGKPLLTLSNEALHAYFASVCGQLPTGEYYLFAPVVKARKGHHQPLADWASKQQFQLLRIDGKHQLLETFSRLDRYKLHDIEIAMGKLSKGSTQSHWESLSKNGSVADELFDAGLKLGKGTCFISDAKGHIHRWFSSKRTDPETGESYPEADPKQFSWNSSKGWCECCHGYGEIYHWMQKDESYTALPKRFIDGIQCPKCNGTRLNPSSSSVKLQTRTGNGYSLPELLQLTPSHILKTLDEVTSDNKGLAVLKEVIPEIRERLRFMDEVGLGYLSLDRSTATLSGGEAQRIRLAAQLGSNLAGVLYVLDEPSIGLHAKDNARLLESLKRLKAKGNTLLIVEHDEDTMRLADRIIDLGPGAGRFGGEIIADGSPDELLKNKQSITGKILLEGIPHPLQGAYRKPSPAWSPRQKTPNWLVIREANLRNLKKIDVTVALRRLNLICGISGAGKSTLIRDLLKPATELALKKDLTCLKGKDYPRLPGEEPLFKDLFNGNAFRSVIEVDQSPIGRTPRSTPATYIGAFDLIRQLYGNLPEARLLGFSPGSFSFNTKGGRCEKCQGAGRIKMEMNFMPDTYVCCDECNGRRFGSELLQVEWKGKNIADVLEMSFEEAAEFFATHHRLSESLKLMVETGLGYLQLGQSSTTLSGGEAQRMKLVSELIKGIQSYKEKGRGITPQNLYILEEPTIGLHFSDCILLIKLLHTLVDRGHTVIVIEHNLDVIAEADHVIELGPEGGDQGGELIYEGTIAGLLKCKNSPTGLFLQEKYDEQKNIS